MRKNSLSILVIGVLFLSYTYQIFNTKKYQYPDSVIAWDIISYYAYLPATFIEKDYQLRFLDTKKNVAGTYWPQKTEEGKYVIKTTMGLAIMYSPFFFIAHIVAPFFSFEPNGFTQPYALALILSSVFYVILGFCFVRKLLLNYFSDKIISLVLLIIGLTSNLFWYTTLEAPMSHAYSFFLFALFIYFTEKWHKKNTLKNSIFLGLIFGLIGLIRPTNSLIIFTFLFYQIQNFKEKYVLLKRSYVQLFVIAMAAFLVCIPQFLYWKSLTGQYLYFSYGENERFFFSDPKIMAVLFSFRKGWLIYTPIVILALVGIPFMAKNKTKEHIFGLSLFLIINIYVVSCWWSWWYGGGFGMRALIESYALLSIPLASLLTWIFKQKTYLRLALLTVVLFLSLQSGFHTVQYYYGSIHWDSMTKEAYKDSFWKIRPSSDFQNLIEAPNYKQAQEGMR